MIIIADAQTVLARSSREDGRRNCKSDGHRRWEVRVIFDLWSLNFDLPLCRFKMLVPQLQMYWSSPFQVWECIMMNNSVFGLNEWVISVIVQISLTLFMLYQKLGWAAFMGVLVMLSLIPLNIVVSKKIKGWQVLDLWSLRHRSSTLPFQMRMMELKDERIKMCNEVLSGIKVGKPPSKISWIHSNYWKTPVLVYKKFAILNHLGYIILGHQALWMGACNGEDHWRYSVCNFSCKWLLWTKFSNAEMDLIRKSGILRSGLDVLNVTAPFAVSHANFVQT